ncbi:MAG: hypothetical protein AAFX52_11145 [Pseudomonadota bacterium]
MDGMKPFSKTAGGLQTFYRTEEEGGGRKKRVMGHRQDMEGFLDDQKRRQVDARGTFTRDGCWGTHVACIPEIVQLLWYNQYGVTVWDMSDPDMLKKVMRLLDDPEWKYLRVEQSRLT